MLKIGLITGPGVKTVVTSYYKGYPIHELITGFRITGG
jgi:hypothetical protein